MPAPLHVEETGTGAPLVALHGFGASSYTWRNILDVLGASHHVHAVDLKGSGRAPKPIDGHYAMRDQAGYVLAHIAQRQLTGITLVGHSFGGGVALLTALELMRLAPGALRALVLFASPAFHQSLPLFIQILRAPIVGPLVQHLASEEMQVRSVLRMAYHHPSRIPADTVEAYAAPLRMPGGPEALRATAQQIEPHDIDAIAARYPSIHVPTLLVWGSHDRIVPLAVGDRLHRAISTSQLAIIDDAGHMPHEETPDRVRPVLRDFLRSVTP